MWKLFSEQPEQQRQNGAQNQARHDGKMKAEIFLRVIDVARQTAKPVFADTRPEQRANCREQQTGNHKKFSHFIHGDILENFSRADSFLFLRKDICV
jgi:hypothetical protein